MLRVWVENRELLVPVAQVKSVISLQDRQQDLDPDNPGPHMGEIKVNGQIVPLYDLGRVFRQRAAGRAHALVLRGRPLAIACDRVAEILEIPEQLLNGENGKNPHEEWVQARCVNSGVKVININKIKEIFGIYAAP
ncbi:MAG: chemotaxis protein CheW [Gammaproteobacteria bacterium]|nr:chemotaxis protein CheW [Gammaproteobacteria bacterium]